MTKQDLSGRIGIVTGAGKGIGGACAVELARLGAKVVACARSRNDLDALVARIESNGGEATAVVADVRNYSDMVSVAATCMSRYGGLNFAVANAGMVVLGSVADGDPEDWRTLIETNVLGTAHTIKAVLPTMRAQRHGDIVIISSMSGYVIYTGEPMYVASKWALTGLGGCVRMEAREYNVRVTQIEPGLVDTPMIRASEEGLAELAESVPITAEDCARTVAFAIAQPEPVTIARLAVLSSKQKFVY
jgi:NADP-dependent 3-hydroxy acid dehydrogenase YdfG